MCIRDRDLAKVIRANKNGDSYVIFITNYTDYAVDGYELDIFRYILKDQMEEKLPQALEEIGKRMNIQSGEYYLSLIHILANYGMEVIDSGVAVLCMHAPWEITSKADVFEAYKGYKAFILDM